MTKVGDLIQIRACKADGNVYRHWTVAIESVAEDSIVTVGQAGSPVFNANGKVFHIQHHMRAYYWFDKFYSLLEVFKPTGELVEIYVNIGSILKFENGVLTVEDNELDVSKHPPHPAVIVDEDEFAEAILKYQYPPEFQEKVYATAREALTLAESWKAGHCPVF